MKIETLQVAGFEPAFHGMRNPMNSWDKSDSILHDDKILLIGEADMKLAQNLILAGTEHGKFMRQIQVWADVTMPRYWWSEADTYGFGTKNSESTMHTIMKKEIDITMFEVSPNDGHTITMCIDRTIKTLNSLREDYIQTDDYEYVLQMKKILPESFLQMRTWNTNYAELRNMYFQRKNHRMTDEWQDTFCKWVESLPYAKELIMIEKV